jgi:ubiquinone/menaquinone biosynthesis C-methylase UbiE
MVDIFQRKGIDNLSFIQGNLFDGLPFDDNTVDVVSLNYGICAFSKEQWEAVAKEVNRVLKLGGYFISREPGRLVSTNLKSTNVS